LDLRCKEVRRDLADPYQMHSTLCRAFSLPEEKCLEGAFLWRIEPERSTNSVPTLILQSKVKADWSRIGITGWLAKEPDSAINIIERLRLNTLAIGQSFRYRLRANPCVTRQRKRIGLLQTQQQEAWIDRKGIALHGFSLPRLSSFELTEQTQSRPDVGITEERMLHGNRRKDGGASISLFSVLFDGFLTVTDPEKFKNAILCGIGHGKALGLGMLSVVPVANFPKME
jgi:CRISPR system Cascade subunit CasE